MDECLVDWTGCMLVSILFVSLASFYKHYRLVEWDFLPKSENPVFPSELRNVRSISRSIGYFHVLF